MAAQVPWFPHSIDAHVGGADELRLRWRYVIVEEIIDGTAHLQRWPWPLADTSGHVLWPAADRASVQEAAVAVSTLVRRLYRPHHVRRHPRVGDTFAALDAEGPGWDAERVVEQVRDLFPSLVLDVSAEARAAARLAYEGSLVKPVAQAQLDPAEVRRARASRSRLTSRALLERPEEARPDGRGAGQP